MSTCSKRLDPKHKQTPKQRQKAVGLKGWRIEEGADEVSLNILHSY